MACGDRYSGAAIVHRKTAQEVAMASVQPVRSTFVSVLAWIFIGLAGFATLIGILQNIMLQLVFLPAMAQASAQTATMPPPFDWMFAHLIWFFRGVLLMAATMLTASIGLLLRKNWGRLLFIAMLVVTILYQLGGLVVQWWVVGTMADAMQMAPHAPDDFSHGMQAMLTVMRVFGVLLALGIGALCGWLIHRLSRPATLIEFGVAP